MAMAFRPRLSPTSIASRYGSQALGRLTTAESVITSFSLAGFEVALDFPLVERFSGLGLQLGSRASGITAMAGFAAPESVITSFSLAGFEVALDFPLVERFSGLGLQLGSRASGITAMAGFAAPESVITSAS